MGTTVVSINLGISSLYMVKHISLTVIRIGSQVRGAFLTDSTQFKKHLPLHLLSEAHEDCLSSSQTTYMVEDSVHPEHALYFVGQSLRIF